MALFCHNTTLQVSAKTQCSYDRFPPEWREHVTRLSTAEALPAVNEFLEVISTGSRLSVPQMLYYFAAYVAILRAVNNPPLTQNDITIRLRAIRNHWHQNVRTEDIFDSLGFKILRTDPRPPRPHDISQAQKDRAINSATDEMMSRIEAECCPFDQMPSYDINTQTGHDALVRLMCGSIAFLMATTVIRCSNVNSKQSKNVAIKWASRSRLPNDTDTNYQQRVSDYELGHSMQHKNVFMGSESQLQSNTLPTASQFVWQNRLTPELLPRWVKFRMPTDKTHQEGKQSQEFYIDAKSCPEHFKLVRMLATVARFTKWNDDDALFFSCPARPTKYNRPRRTDKVRNIRYNDISNLVKRIAAAEQLVGAWAPTSFKRKGMNDIFMDGGYDVDVARLQSRHASSSAYNRYLLSMNGPAGFMTSNIHPAANVKSTLARPAVTNQLLRLNNTGISKQTGNTKTGTRFTQPNPVLELTHARHTSLTSVDPVRSTNTESCPNAAASSQSTNFITTRSLPSNDPVSSASSDDDTIFMSRQIKNRKIDCLSLHRRQSLDT